MSDVLIWWFIIEILGLSALPIVYWVFRWLPDRGFTTSKAVGLLLASYIFWLGGMTGFLSNTSSSILFSILLILGISAWIFLRTSMKDALSLHIRKHIKMIITFEVLFTVLFIAWAVLRAFAPDKVMSAGGEKFMEMAFLNGILNSPSFPPLDPWLSGFSISYYYFGYIMMALLTRFSGVPAGVGFELYDALLFSLAAIGVFGIVYNLVYYRIEKTHPGFTPPANYGPIRYGLLGSLLVLILGNLEGMLESIYAKGILSGNFWRWLDIPGLINAPITGRWLPEGGFFGCCWRASRVLAERNLLNQPTNLDPITEFPIFSFLLGDNHPHVLALPFVLLAIALALNLIYRQIQLPRLQTDSLSHVNWWNPGKFSLDGDWVTLFFYALSLGALGFLNTWDMPIYLGVVTLAYFIGECAREHKFSWMLLLRSTVLLISLTFFAFLFYILFYFGFSSQAGGILPYVFKPTRLPQYLVMFGIFIFFITWFLMMGLKHLNQANSQPGLARRVVATWGWLLLICSGLIVFFLLVILAVGAEDLINNPLIRSFVGDMSLSSAIQQFITSRLLNPWLFLLLTGLLSVTLVNMLGSIRNQAVPDKPERTSPMLSFASDQFIFILILVALSLTLSVELFYLRDNFGVRMNTVFKFYYQAWVMLGIASAYGIWWIFNVGKPGSVGKTVFITLSVIFIGAGLIYPVIGSYNRVNGFQTAPNLDGTSGLAAQNPDDWAAIEWLKANTQGNPIILEAPGKSYNYEGRISAFSGFPSLLGWAFHEGQWRGNYDEQGKREPDIQAIYTTKDSKLALELLRTWNINYVIIGQPEINYIQQICADPQKACNLSRAVGKFDAILTPVYQQGNVIIYKVPGVGS